MKKKREITFKIEEDESGFVLNIKGLRELKKICQLTVSDKEINEDNVTNDFDFLVATIAIAIQEVKENLGLEVAEREIRENQE